MTFGSTHHFWALSVAALSILLAAVLRQARARRLRALLADPARARMLRQPAPSLDRTRQILGGLGLLLVAFALASPQWGYTWRDVRRRGLDIQVVLDTSNSMRANDLRPDRLQRAKWGLQDLLKRLQGDRIGLIAFAGSSFVQCPLTLDYAAFRMHLDDIRPGIIPRGGTDIAGALERAMESFPEATGADQVILLITDGESHEGDVGPIIQKLQEKRIRVYAVGVGTPEGELIPDGNGGFLKNRQNEVIKTTLDEDTLKRIALDTQGLYVRASPKDFGLERIFDQGLDHLKRAQLEQSRIREMEDRYQIFLGAGILLFVLEGLARIPGWLSQRRART
jgi:Ca-activated chloride channel family protein